MSKRIWKDHVNSYFGCVGPDEVEVEQFSKSWMEGLSPLAWRVPILLWALTVTSWSMTSFWGPFQMYFLYMTHWGLVLILIETLLGIFVAIRKPFVNYDDATFGLPWYVKTYWVLYNITIPVAFLITVFYWCLLKRSSVKVNYAPNPILDVMLHGANSLVMLLELVCSAHPSRLFHIVQPLMFAAAYLLFSVVYYSFGGQDPWGNDFIYPVVDWSKPNKTLVVVTLTALFLALMHAATVAVAALRDFVARRCNPDLGGGVENKGFVTVA